MNENVLSKRHIEIRDLAAIGFAAVILFSFLWWIIQLFNEGAQSSQFGLFFLTLNDFFADLQNDIGYVVDKDPYVNNIHGSWEHGYPPLAYLVYYPFVKIADWSGDYFLQGYTQTTFLIMLIICIFIVMIIFFYVMYLSLKGMSEPARFLLPFSLCISFPMLFTIERGNSLILAVFFCVVYIMFYESENVVVREIAIISLAIAAGLKMSPAVLGILLLYKKRWFDSVRCAIYGILLFFLPFLFFKGTLIDNLLLMYSNMTANLDFYGDEKGASLIASFYQIGQVMYGEDYVMAEFTHDLLRNITLIVSVFLLIVGAICKKEWQRVLIATIASVIIPSHTGTYNVLYFIPFTLVLFKEFENKVLYYITALALIPLYWVHVGQKYTKLYYASTPLLTVIAVVIGVVAIYQFVAEKRKAKAA